MQEKLAQLQQMAADSNIQNPNTSDFSQEFIAGRRDAAILGLEIINQLTNGALLKLNLLTAQLMDGLSKVVGKKEDIKNLGIASLMVSFVHLDIYECRSYRSSQDYTPHP